MSLVLHRYYQAQARDSINSLPVEHYLKQVDFSDLPDDIYHDLNEKFGDRIKHAVLTKDKLELGHILFPYFEDQFVKAAENLRDMEIKEVEDEG